MNIVHHKESDRAVVPSESPESQRLVIIDRSGDCFTELGIIAVRPSFGRPGKYPVHISGSRLQTVYPDTVQGLQSASASMDGIIIARVFLAVEMPAVIGSHLYPRQGGLVRRPHYGDSRTVHVAQPWTVGYPYS